jgi:hypothetical protein
MIVCDAHNLLQSMHNALFRIPDHELLGVKTGC